EAKKSLSSGIAALIAVNDGRATVAVGVTEDLTDRHNAVELVQAGVAAVGGKGGGGRPDMAQGGGPDGATADQAIAAIKAMIAG
ncbi:DHHA1 domain-containing protein, partial [Parasphingorhabdus sp.]